MYPTEFFPYNKPNEQMTDRHLEKAFAIILEQIPKRVSNISAHLQASFGVSVGVGASDSELDKMPAAIASLGRWRHISDDEFESMLSEVKPDKRELMRAMHPQEMLDGETLAMVFDAALLLGEVFRFRYPGATWSIGAKPKSSVNYGDPVVVGIDKFRMEFGVQMQMHGAVGLAMSNNQIGPR